MSDEALRDLADAWVSAFGAALADGDPDAVAALFAEETYWRDLLALTGDIGWVGNRDAVADALLRGHHARSSSGWRVSARYSPPRRTVRIGRDVVEAFLEFETAAGPGVGVVRLSDDGDTARAWVLLTRLADLGAEPRLRPRTRPQGVGYDPAEGRTWRERRAAEHDYADRDPEVLIVGAGHSGLFLAAHLRRLGVDALVVDRLERLGDAWRQRYEALALHNSTDMVQFPYLPFPDTYPQYLPKDQLADWFEIYARAMELTCWTSTRFEGAEHDSATGRWTARLVRDGRAVELRPRHVVLATGGVGGSPSIPALPGIDDFAGEVLHTKDFRSGEPFAGRHVLVVGVGSSGHDVAHDLVRHDAAGVTMLQRNPASIVSLEGANLSYTFFNDGTPIEEADLMSATGFIQPLLVRNFQAMTRVTNEHDRELLAGLRAAGLRIDDGEDGTGWQLKFFARNGGYYIDVGCSARIVDGTIGILQAADVDRFTPAGVRLLDGSERPLDAVVLATGYLNQQEELRRYFGDDVADAVGPVSGFGPDGELRNAWRRTAQPGLWIMISGFSAARTYSPLVALQIAGDLADAGVLR